MAATYNIYKICGFCGGSGKENSSEGEINCTKCDGSGKWLLATSTERVPPEAVDTWDVYKICGFCGGPGTIPPTDYTCPMCGGDGKYLWAEQVLQE